MGHRRCRRCRRWSRRWSNRWRTRWRGCCRILLLRRRCFRRCRHLDVVAGLEERGRLVPAIGRVCKHGMRARCQPARADRIQETGADRAGSVRSAGSQDTAAAAIIAQRDQDQAALWPVFAGNLYINAGGARGWRNGNSRSPLALSATARVGTPTCGVYPVGVQAPNTSTIRARRLNRIGVRCWTTSRRWFLRGDYRSSSGLTPARSVKCATDLFCQRRGGVPDQKNKSMMFRRNEGGQENVPTGPV